MNFVGHHEIARRRGLDNAARLGAMLPDFASMLGVRIDREVLPAAVDRGVVMHHATDASFHAHQAVQRGMHALATALAARGLARGPARAIGHVGYEMLLDSSANPGGLADALDCSADTGVIHAMRDHPEWRPMCRHLAQRVARYDDPAWVAERLFLILGRRPRLAFPIEQTPTVAAVLADTAPEIHRCAPAIFDEVTLLVRELHPTGCNSLTRTSRVAGTRDV
jgi:hypothetical protein